MALIPGSESRLCLHCSPRGRIAGQPCNRSSQGTGRAAALDDHQRPDRLGQRARDGAGPRRARPSPPPVDAHAGIVGQTRLRVGDHLTPALIALRAKRVDFAECNPHLRSEYRAIESLSNHDFLDGMVCSRCRLSSWPKRKASWTLTISTPSCLEAQSFAVTTDAKKCTWQQKD
jgi:hypothetical protein